MAALNDIRRRIGSVTNTRKITYAMKLVSAAKLRKAQEAVVQARDYRNKINELLASILADPAVEVSDPLLDKRPVKTVKIVVVGGNRGLCGGYNTNLYKKLDSLLKEQSQAGASVEIVCVGKKPAEYLRRTRRDYAKAYEELGEDASTWPVAEIMESLVNDFQAGKCDQVILVYTHFKSALSMQVKADVLLPLSPESVTQAKSASTKTSAGVTLFEPSPKDVFSALLPRVGLCNLTQACLDAKASEHGSRMTAMDAATKNAGELRAKLTLYYNKIRQQKITAELLDIVGGAEAIS